MNGYLGKILHVNLSTCELRDEPLDPDLARKYVGGSGLAARLIVEDRKSVV